MIKSTGIEIDNFYIPPFTADKGDILVIQLPNGPDFMGLLFRLADVLIGNERNENIELKTELKFVRHVNENGLWNSLFPLRVDQYIKKYGNPQNDLPMKIYEYDEIKKGIKINRLAGNSRKILSLLTTFSWTDKIVFDLAGVDPIGGQRAFDIVKKQIGNTGVALLIDHCDDFKNKCTRLVKFEMIRSKN